MPSPLLVKAKLGTQKGAATCIGLRGLGVLKMVDSEISKSAAMLVLNWNLTKFLML